MSLSSGPFEALLDLNTRFENGQFVGLERSELSKYLCPVLGRLINYYQQARLCKILVDFTRLGCVQAIMACDLAVQVLPKKMTLYNRQLMENLTRIRPNAQRVFPVLSGEAFPQCSRCASTILKLPTLQSFIIASVHRVILRWFSKVQEDMRNAMSQYILQTFTAANEKPELSLMPSQSTKSGALVQTCSSHKGQDRSSKDLSGATEVNSTLAKDYKSSSASLNLGEEIVQVVQPFVISHSDVLANQLRLDDEINFMCSGQWDDLTPKSTSFSIGPSIHQRSHLALKCIISNGCLQNMFVDSTIGIKLDNGWKYGTDNEVLARRNLMILFCLAEGMLLLFLLSDLNIWPFASSQTRVVANAVASSSIDSDAANSDKSLPSHKDSLDGACIQVATTSKSKPFTPAVMRSDSSESSRRRHQSSTHVGPQHRKSYMQLLNGSTNNAFDSFTDKGSLNTEENSTTTPKSEWVQLIIRHVYGKDSWVMRPFENIPMDFGQSVNCSSFTDPSSLLGYLCGKDAFRIPPKENENVQRTLRLLDKVEPEELHAVGVLYLGEDQSSEAEILANQYGSERYVKFMRLLGEVASLADDPEDCKWANMENSRTNIKMPFPK
uniref:Rap-GAP domain-containing protein n=1 Tax=Ditylenchus dipsaci TaxID=166011 RepID=A0A915E4T4_9BILA